MKLIIIVSLVIIILSIIILYNTNCDISIYESFISSINGEQKCITEEKKEKLCFNPCPARKTIHNEILILKDDIDAIQIKMSSYDKKIDTLLKSKNEDDEDNKDQIETLNRSKTAAKAHTVSSLAGPSSEMSGLSHEETHAMLGDHYSKPVTSNSLNESMKKQPRISKKDLHKKNKKQAKMIDNQNKSDVSINAVKTSNSYINTNRAKCNCPEEITSEHPNLEKDIIDKADRFGFHTRRHGGVRCDPDDDCAKKYAKQKLKELCVASECEVVNPNGQYPYNLKN